ncbi:hypothetical protein NDN08_005097 [Rhodosorus marinus]|uniref:PrsW family intramembrane metalloprotease n=1 Tax=Rhodosorus marinus TaxID=101924 RepID=A0AAV8V0H9_9RHOD|nr:hypothetical protein NDN08_005097 [Rhodosorus marinus]
MKLTMAHTVKRFGSLARTGNVTDFIAGNRRRANGRVQRGIRNCVVVQVKDSGWACYWTTRVAQKNGFRIVSFLSGKRMRFNLLEWTIGLFVVLPIALFLVAEQCRDLYVFGLRAVELVDLLLITPSLVLALVSLHFLFLEEKPRSSRCLSVILIVVFAYFQAVHWTANLLNSFLTEWRLDLGKESVPIEFYELVYWLDEYLSHLILFGALFGHLCLCVVKGESVGHPSADVRVLFFGGVIGGLSHACAFIESQHVQLSFVLGIPLLVASSYRFFREALVLRGRDKASLDIVRRYPFLAYSFAEAISLQLGPCIYSHLFGSLEQPSELGGYLAMVRLALSAIFYRVGSPS